MALERVSMLEDQLAASSQEVKSDLKEIVCLVRFQLIWHAIKILTRFCLVVRFVSHYSGNLFKRPN